MRTVGLFEAKQKLSELVQRAREGEKIGITRRGELTAILVPAAPETSLRDVFQDIDTESSVVSARQSLGTARALVRLRCKWNQAAIRLRQARSQATRFKIGKSARR